MLSRNPNHPPEQDRSRQEVTIVVQALRSLLEKNPGYDQAERGRIELLVTKLGDSQELASVLFDDKEKLLCRKALVAVMREAAADERFGGYKDLLSLLTAKF